jgi:hypothetical protein
MMMEVHTTRRFSVRHRGKKIHGTYTTRDGCIFVHSDEYGDRHTWFRENPGAMARALLFELIREAEAAQLPRDGE